MLAGVRRPPAGDSDAIAALGWWRPFIDDSGSVSGDLRQLVAASGTEKWQGAWEMVFLGGAGYRRIVGDLDIDSATLKQLVSARPFRFPPI